MLIHTDRFNGPSYQPAMDTLFDKSVISDYHRLANTLPYLEPTDACCSAAWLTPICIEPVNERTLDYLDERSCVVQCSSCGRMFVSWC